MLTVILGFMVYAAGVIIKFTSPDMKFKPWWNNVFSTLTAVRLYTCEPDHLSGTVPSIEPRANMASSSRR